MRKILREKYLCSGEKYFSTGINNFCTEKKNLYRVKNVVL